MASSAVNPESPPELKKGIDMISSTPTNNLVVVEVVLRVILFATTLTSVLALVTGKQTKFILIPFPPYRASVLAELTDSPAFM